MTTILTRSRPCSRGRPAATSSLCNTGHQRHVRLRFAARMRRCFLKAPQVFVSGGYYSFGVDVWSSACIMAELMRCYCTACESDQHEVREGRGREGRCDVRQP